MTHIPIRMILLVLIAGLLAGHEALASPLPHPAYNLMIAAAAKQKAAQADIYMRKRELGLFDPGLDPNHTGMIGVEFSRITSTIGVLKAKRTSTNPDFAALIARELVDNGLDVTDTVLVTMTGSFPALNLAVIMALESLGIPSLRICSVGSSSYGANQEEFTWLDMEDLLVRSGRLAGRTDWITLGGTGDIGGGLPHGGRDLLKARAEQLNYTVVKASSLRKQTSLRRKLLGSPERFALLINVGGNQAMLGRGKSGRELPGGWIDPQSDKWANGGSDSLNGIVFDFLSVGVPVLNLLHVEDIATTHGLPVDPEPMPPVGESPIYYISEERAPK